MKKEEIINQETLWNYCYNKAKNNVLKSWNFDVEEIENINNNESIIFKAFFKMHESIRIDEEIELIKKYYLNDRIEKEINKCLKKYRSCTSIWIKRIEYFITREII